MTGAAAENDRRVADTSHAGMPPLKGCEPQRALLDLAWADATSGQPALVLVTGEAGSGKSTLLADFALRRAAAGSVVSMQADALGAAVPLRLAGRLLARILGLGPEARSTDEIQLAVGRVWAGNEADAEVSGAFRYILSGGAELARQTGAQSGPGQRPYAGMAPEHTRAVAFFHFNALLRHAAQREPLAIVIDNLKWVDEASLAWLESFAASLAESDRVALIVAGRHLQGAPVQGTGPVQILRLDLEPRDPEARDLEPRDPEARAPEPSDLEAEPVGDRPTSTLDLSEGGAELHGALAALGSPVPAAWARGLAGDRPDVLEELFAAGIVALDFLDSDFMVVADQLPPENENRRQAHHERIALFLAETGQDPAVVAAQFAAAGLQREAGRYLLEAAERSLACVAPRTAMEQIQQAAALLGQLPAEEAAWHARLLEARAAAHAAAGSLVAAILHSRQRLALDSPPEDLCRAYDRHIGYLVKKGEPGQAQVTCQEALTRIPEGTPGRTKLVARRAQSLLLGGRHQEALSDCATCLAALEPGSDPHLAGFANFLWGGVELRRLDLLKARSAFENALAHFRSAGDLYDQAITLSDLGTVHIRLGEEGRAAECFDLALQLAERIGERRLRAVLLNNQGMLVHQQGQMAPARSFFERALAIHRDMDDQRSMGIALLNLGEVCLALGQRDEADKYLSEALRVNEKIGAWDIMAETYRQIARLEGERGSVWEALDAIKQGTQIAEQTGQVELQGVMLRLLAALQYDLANPGEALAAVSESIEILVAIDAPLELGRSYAELGRLLGLQGQDEQAATAYGQAAALFTRLNAQFELEQLPPTR